MTSVSSLSIWQSLTAMVAETSVSMTPWATCVGLVPSRRTTPQPRCRVPGSIPRTIMFASDSTRPVSCHGEDLAGVQETLRVEHRLQAFLQIDESVGLLERKVRGFREADAMFARERSPH